MDAIRYYIVPYIISNILFGVSIYAAVKKPWVTRVFWAVIFLWASIINTKTAIINPTIYLEYANLAFDPFYKNFILGYFAEHTRILVLSIAIMQFLIFVGLVLNKFYTLLACTAGIIFGISIAPLGVGSAFPATIMMAISILLIMLKPEHDYIWRRNQYSSARVIPMKN